MKNLTKTVLALGLVSLLGFGGMPQEAEAAQTSASNLIAKTNTAPAKKRIGTRKKKTNHKQTPQKRSRQQRAYRK